MNPQRKTPEIWLIRHGQTAWSITGQLSGRHDLPLTAHGESEAAALVGLLAGRRFDRVLCSPLRRAVRTCELAGYLGVAALEPDIMEWDYGACTGSTEAEMRARYPGWTLWGGVVPSGEAIADIAARARRAAERIREIGGSVALFSHGHFLRVFVTQWLGLPPETGRQFDLHTGAVCILADEGGVPMLRQWNYKRSER